MAEAKESTLSIPVSTENKGNSSNKLALDSLLNPYIKKSAFERLLTVHDRVSKEAQRAIYAGIYAPNYKEYELTEQSERNRQILLWAIDRRIYVPQEYWNQKSYSSAETKNLLQKMFSPKQIQELQGAFVYQVAREMKEVNPENTLAIGGIIYTQSAIGEQGDSLIIKALKRQLAVSSQFTEPGILPPILRKNVKGSVHVLPYGEAEKSEGKEKETLLMLSDDMLTLIAYLEKDKKFGFPRFILNVTNKTMGTIAQRYMGAQVAKPGPMADFITESVIQGTMKKNPPNQEVVAVFLPEQELRKGKDRLPQLRDKLYRVSTRNEDISLPEALKRIRIEAILEIAKKIDFPSIYAQSVAPIPADTL